MCLILRWVLVSSEPYCTLSISSARTANGRSVSANFAPGDEDLGVGQRGDPGAGIGAGHRRPRARHPRHRRRDCRSRQRSRPPSRPSPCRWRGRRRFHSRACGSRSAAPAFRRDDVEIDQRHKRVLRYRRWRGSGCHGGRCAWVVLSGRGSGCCGKEGVKFGTVGHGGGAADAGHDHRGGGRAAQDRVA